MIVYLDNAATTPMSNYVFESMKPSFIQKFGNPSSMHSIGYEAECMVKEAKQKIAKILHCDTSELIITSGGTESINTVIYGVCTYGKSKHIVSSDIEHSATYNILLEVEKFGNKISFIGVDKNGLLSMEELNEILKDKIDLFSLIWVNNEIGTIQRIEEIVRLIRKKQPKCLIHLDATQAIGKIKIDLSVLNIDLISGSAHKLHGPKGVGILYKRKGCNIKPLILGGGQQGGFRSGTENVAGTIGMAAAIEESYTEFERKRIHLKNLKERLIIGLGDLENVRINSPLNEDFSNHILSLCGSGVRSEVLLHELANRGIYISAGSACHSNSKNRLSRTLQAIGLPVELQEGTIRISLSTMITMEEIEYSIAQIRSAIEELMKYVRR